MLEFRRLKPQIDDEREGETDIMKGGEREREVPVQRTIWAAADKPQMAQKLDMFCDNYVENPRT